MSYQVFGYFENPATSKSKELARFTYKDDLTDRQTAQEIAQKWRDSDRYPFIFIYDTTTRESELQK